MKLIITAINIDAWHFKLRCQWDEEGQKALMFQLRKSELEYGPIRRLPNGKWEMGWEPKEKKLYYRAKLGANEGELYFLRGFAPYVSYFHGRYMTNPEVLSNVNPEYEELNFPGLYEWQNADLNQMTKYKRGLFSTRPGYGKSQCIATYVQYLLDKGKKVLVSTPSSKSLDELIMRYNKLNGKNWKKFDVNSPLNFVNSKGFPRQNIYKEIPQDWFDSIDVLLLDEAEYNTAKSSSDLFCRLNNVKQVYAFSATADAKKGGIVSIKGGINGSVKDNIEVAGLLGFTLVYSKAQGYDITIHEVLTECFTDAWFRNLYAKKELEEAGEEDTGTYQELMQDLYQNWKFCRLMEAISRREGCMFVPINQLQILDYWNDNVLQDQGEQTCIISSRGIELFTADGNGNKSVELIKLDRLKDIVKSGDKSLKLIFGTRSAFNAIDLPGLSCVMPVSNKMASSVIQYVGRAARGQKFDVYIPIPAERKSCPVLWKDGRAREELILNYYSECKIQTKFESEAMYFGTEDDE